MAQCLAAIDLLAEQLRMHICAQQAVASEVRPVPEFWLRSNVNKSLLAAYAADKAVASRGCRRMQRWQHVLDSAPLWTGLAAGAQLSLCNRTTLATPPGCRSREGFRHCVLLRTVQRHKNSRARPSKAQQGNI